MLSRRLWFLLSAPIPSGLLGVLVLWSRGMAAPRVALMLGAIVAGTILAPAITAVGRGPIERFAPALAAGGLALLGATLLGEGLLGVHRWVALGPVAQRAA